ncbi:hypothetical protein FACS1894110_01450 [Spirochaetia bacterium]|nr:hypothetical protein FACS1894110_01450 [Spirochaetia bacterium]
MVKKILLVPCLLLLFVRVLSAQSDDFARGEELFMQNKPKEAQAILEKITAQDPSNVKAFLYLGIVYQQLDMIDEAITTYRRILPRAGNEQARIAYNLGNAYYIKGSAVFAEQYYTQAIEADPGYASAYLNRGNTRIKAGSLNTAMPDYELFLILEPNSPKRPQIEQLMAFIREESTAEDRRKEEAAEQAERQKIVAENAAKEEAAAAEQRREQAAAFAEQQKKIAEETAERQRIAAENAAKDAAERRQRMMDELSASLQSSAENTRGLSAGSEDVLGYEGEFELE